MLLGSSRLLSVVASLLLLVNTCPAQTQQINGTNFTFVHEHIDSTDADVVILKRDSQNVLTHIIEHHDGDCSGEWLELGCYEIKDSQIYFYSYWASADRMFSNALQFGARRQVYGVSNTGKVRMLQSALYIEDMTTDDNRIAIAYLHSTPKTIKQKEALKKYEATCEATYHAKFVTGAAQKQLLSEVRKKLYKEIQKNTKHWKSAYTHRKT
jgi:hypothetical protein